MVRLVWGIQTRTVPSFDEEASRGLDAFLQAELRQQELAVHLEQGWNLHMDRLPGQ